MEAPNGRPSFVSAGAAAANQMACGSMGAAFTENTRGRASPRTPAPDARAAGFTAAGRPRVASIDGQRNGAEMLLIQQNQLLMEQLQIMQAQLQRSQSQFEAAGAQDALRARWFTTPEQIAKDVDPALRQLFDSFAKEARHLLEAWETQKKLAAKYGKLREEGKIHTHLQAEADYKWQWTKLYMTKAKPTEADERNMQHDEYDVAAAWAAMRDKHAKECFEFICLHQQQCVSLYEQEVSLSSLQQKLCDRVTAWFAQHAYNDQDLQKAMIDKARQFVEQLIRSERPKIQSRMDKEKEQQEKRERALLEARSKWEELDVKDVLSPALLELKNLGTKQHRSMKIQDDSALAFLIKDNPELCHKHKVKTVPAQKSSSSARAPTPKRRPRKQSRSPKNRRIPNSDSSRSASLPRSIMKSPSRSNPRSSRSPSGQRSDSQKRVRFAASPGKNKGKGKGRGKGKSKRK